MNFAFCYAALINWHFRVESLKVAITCQRHFWIGLVLQFIILFSATYKYLVYGIWTGINQTPDLIMSYIIEYI